MHPVEGAKPEKAVTESFNNGAHRVCNNQPAVYFRNGRNRINNRRGIHGQLDSKRDQEG